jgi:hypothetical protein
MWSSRRGAAMCFGLHPPSLIPGPSPKREKGGRLLLAWRGRLITTSREARGTLAMLATALLLAGCATPPPERPEEINCPTGEIACIKAAQQKCPDHRIVVFNVTPHNTVDVGELPPDAEISEATIGKNPTTIICEKPGS